MPNVTLDSISACGKQRTSKSLVELDVGGQIPRNTEGERQMAKKGWGGGGWGRKHPLSCNIEWFGECRITNSPLGGTADPHLVYPEPVSMVTSLEIYGENWPCPLGVRVNVCVCVCMKQFLSVPKSQLCAAGTVDMQLSKR